MQDTFERAIKGPDHHAGAIANQSIKRPQPPIQKPPKSSARPESRVCPGCETPATSAGAGAARLPYSGRRGALLASVSLRDASLALFGHVPDDEMIMGHGHSRMAGVEIEGDMIASAAEA